MYSLKAKAWLEKDGKFLMSEGRARLLKAIKETQSITKAAKRMGMAYRHAWGTLRKISDSLGEEVVESQRGGKGGGKTYLSRMGREILEEYERRNGMLQTFLARGFETPILATDGIIIHKGKLVAIQRRYYPFEGLYALPGGIVEYGETVEEAVIREMKEETGLDTKVEKLLGVYSSPERDPRGHFISVVFKMKAVGGKLKSGSDAKAVKLLDLENLPKLAFDHSMIVEDFLKEWSREKAPREAG